MSDEELDACTQLWRGVPKWELVAAQAKEANALRRENAEMQRRNEIDAKSYELMSETIHSQAASLRYYEEIVCLDSTIAFQHGGRAQAVDPENVANVMRERAALRSRAADLEREVAAWKSGKESADMIVAALSKALGPDGTLLAMGLSPERVAIAEREIREGKMVLWEDLAAELRARAAISGEREGE